MARRQLWQAFREWFQPMDVSATVSEIEMTSVLSSSQAVGDAFGFEELSMEMEGEAPDDELLDFLAADLDPVPADPEFREHLREQLWALVQDGATSLPKDH